MEEAGALKRDPFIGERKSILEVNMTEDVVKSKPRKKKKVLQRSESDPKRIKGRVLSQLSRMNIEAHYLDAYGQEGWQGDRSVYVLSMDADPSTSVRKIVRL